MQKLKLDVDPTTFHIFRDNSTVSRERWQWELEGQIFVIDAARVGRKKTKLVASIIMEFLHELEVPLTVSIERQPERRRLIHELIGKTSNGKDLEVIRLVIKINKARERKAVLRPGLVVLLDPADVNPFGDPADFERGEYGESHADGVCLLRACHEEAVRHELAHMLGLAEHCKKPRCAMRWECSTKVFCRNCLKKLGEICVVQPR